MYAASRSYFLSEGMKEARFVRLMKLYENPMFEIYLLFIQVVLPVFTTFNLFLQRDASQIYIRYCQMQTLLTKLLSKFIKTAIIQSHKESPFDIALSDQENHLDTTKLFIGLVTKSLISKKLEDGDVTESEVTKFYSAVIAFYVSAVRYVFKWFPLAEPIIKESQFLDFDKKEDCDFSMVCTFIERYPKVFTFTSKELDMVHEEFLDYQSMSIDEIPQHVWDKAVCHEHVGPGSKVTYHRMDRIWGHIADMKLPGTYTARFARLAKVAQLVLTIPHSNAGEERVFSVIHKIRRDDKGKLQLEGTLSSLVSVKLNLPENKTQPCYSFKPSKELQKAKKAT